MSATPRTIVAVGEALWDVFPDGRRPGGAPCNVAFHAAQLGDRGVIVTRVGDDTDGAGLLAFLRARGVETEHVQRDSRRPTGTVLVTVERGEPRYTISEGVAWDHLDAEPDACARVRAADAVVIGSLAQRSMGSRVAIRALLAEARGRAVIVFDVNLRPPFVDAGVVEATCRAANVVKMNDAEAAALGSLLGRPALVPWLMDEVGVQGVCVTHGRDGATLITGQGTVSVPGAVIDAEGGDAVGAGDAFTAAMTHQLIRGISPDAVLRTANGYAALVASRRGAMPSLTPEDLQAVGVSPPEPPPPAGAA
jgi:fructokinase